MPQRALHNVGSMSATGTLATLKSPVSKAYKPLIGPNPAARKGMYWRTGLWFKWPEASLSKLKS